MKTRSAGGFTLIEIMFVVAIIGVLLSIAIPNLTSSMETARAKTCAVNRRNIDGAKASWAAENRQPMDAVPGDGDLFGEGKFIDHKPECPVRGEYSLNAVREKCTCSVTVHTN